MVFQVSTVNQKLWSLNRTIQNYAKSTSKRAEGDHIFHEYQNSYATVTPSDKAICI